jgi:protein-disulfide isomerase
MASRSEQKQASRARRLADARNGRQRRLRMLGGVVIGAAVIVAVAIVLSGGGGGSTGLHNGSGALKTAEQVQHLLGGIAQSGTTLGNPGASVTMTYYSDLECPVCADFTLNSGFPELIARGVRAGRVKVVYRALQTATRDPQTFQNQQVAALAAGKQNRLWDFVELFYRQQGTEGTSYATDTYLSGLAKQIPELNLAAWSAARNDQILISDLELGQQAATTAGIQATPTVIFQGPHGTARLATSMPSYSQLQQAMRSVV